MAIRVAINGFGRIGRQSLKAMLERYPSQLEVVAINDLTDTETNAHLFRYDSTYGIFSGNIELGEGVIRVDGQDIAVLNQRDPSRMPWKPIPASQALWVLTVAVNPMSLMPCVGLWASKTRATFAVATCRILFSAGRKKKRRSGLPR